MVGKCLHHLVLRQGGRLRGLVLLQLALLSSHDVLCGGLVVRELAVRLSELLLLDLEDLEDLRKNSL